MGNTRGVFNMGHKTLSRGDPRFWGECDNIHNPIIQESTELSMEDWTIRELAMYDFPAMVKYICDVTGYDKAWLIT